MRYTQLYILLLIGTFTVNAQQWVSFTVHPHNAILFMDGERHVLTEGFAEMLLAPGNHVYSVESPYFETYADTFNLDSDVRRDITVVLQSGYGYLRLLSHGPKDKIYIDQHEIGTHAVQSIRYNAGTHRLTVLRETLCLCDIGVDVTAGGKSVIDIDSLGITPFPWDPARWLIPLSAIGPGGELTDSTALEEAHATMELGSAAINVTSNVDGAEILIDNRLVGTTPLVVNNLIANRKYLITLRKQGFKTVSRSVLVSEEGITEVNIKLKKH